MQRWVRRLGYAAGAGLLLVAIVLLLLPTPPGRAVLRWALESGAEVALDGEFTVGALEGSPYRSPRLIDVRLRTRDGQVALSLERLALDYSLTALLTGRVHLSRASVEGLTVDWPALERTLPKSSAPTEPDTGDGGGIPAVNIDRLVLDARSVVVSQDLVLRDLRIVGTATLTDDVYAVGIEHAAAERAGSSMRLQGRVVWSGGRLEAARVSARLDEVQVDLRRVETSSHAIDVEGRLRWPPGAAAVALAVPHLRGAADLELRATGDLDRLKVTVGGRLGGGRVGLVASGPRDPIEIAVSADRFDPSRLYDRAPPARLNLDLRVAARVGSGRPTATAEARVSGAIRPLPSAAVIAIDDARIDGRWRDGAVAASARIATSIGRVEVEGAAQPFDAHPTLLGVEAFIDQVRLADLGVGLEGTATATVKASGPLRHPTLTTALRGDQLAVGDVRIGDLEGRLTVGAPPLGQRGGSTRIEWEGLRWAAPAAVWTSTAGLVLLSDGQIGLEQVSFASPRGRIRLSGHVDLSEPLEGATWVTLDLEALDLSTAQGIVRAPAVRPSGLVDGRLRFDPQGGLAAEISLRGVRIDPRTPPVDGRIGALIDSNDARVDIRARGFGGGRLRLDARARPPVKWRNPAAWARLGITAIQRIDAEVEADLHRVFPDAIERGRVSGHVKVSPAGERLDAQVRATEIEAAGLPAVTEASIVALGAADAVKLDARVRLNGETALEIAGEVQAGLPALARRPWLWPPIDFTAATKRFPLELLRLEVPRGATNGEEQPAPVAGRISLEASGHHGDDGDRFLLDVEVQQLKLTPDVPSIGAQVEARVEDQRVTAAAQLKADELGAHRLVLEGCVPARFDAESALGCLERLQFEGRDLSLTAVAALVDLAGVSGRAEARVVAGPGLADLRASVSADDLALHPALAPATLRAELAQTSTETTLRSTVRVAGVDLLEVDGAAATIASDMLRKGFDPRRVPIRGRVHIDRFPLERALKNPIDGRQLTGELTVVSEARGTAAMPSVRSDVDIQALTIGDVRFGRFEVKHRLDGPASRLQAELRQDRGGRLSIDADFTDPEDPAVDVSSVGFRIGVLSTLASLNDTSLSIDGALDGQLSTRGPIDRPSAVGRLILHDLAVVVPGGPPLRQGALALAVNRERLSLDLRAKSGPGTVKADVSAGLTKEERFRVDGRFALDDVAVAGGAQIAIVDLDGVVSGGPEGAGFEAEVMLTDGLVRLPEETSRTLHPITERPDLVYKTSRWQGMSLGGPRSKAPSTPFALRLRASKAIRVRGDPADALVNLDLVARSSRRGPSVSGDVSAEQGTVTLFGRRYTVERGQVTLGGQVPPQPRLDILLSYEFEACAFFIGVSGPASEPKLKLSAVPDIYDDKQLLGFLFGASPDVENPDKTPSQQGIDAAASVLLGQLQAQLRKNLPIDTLAVDLGDGTNSGQANISLGKWLTDRVFVAYSYRHGVGPTENTSEGLLRYRFLPSWLLELAVGDRGNGAADLLWTRRW